MLEPAHIAKLASRLDALCRNNEPRKRVEADPIVFPHSYEDPREIEISAFIAAVLAYGRIDLFKKTIGRILALSDGRLFDYVSAFEAKQERPRFRGLYYRFNTEDDLFSLMQMISGVIKKEGSLGALFMTFYHEDAEDIGPALSRFVAVLRGFLPGNFRPVHAPLSRGLSYLLPSPTSGSACKRLNLFLRWMIRPNDGVDFGLWKAIPPAKLIIPLDTHIIRIARYLQLTARRTPDWKMAREITSVLRQCDPSDPLRYDFALCHLGISGACPLVPNPGKCRICPLQPACFRGNTVLEHGVY